MSDTKKTAAAAEAASLQEDMDAVMRKYDRESATRIWAGKPKIVISVVMWVLNFIFMDSLLDQLNSYAMIFETLRMFTGA